MTHENFAGERFLENWKDFRHSIDRIDDSEIDKLLEFWKPCPLVNRTIDPYSPETWPSAWELIDSGKFCESAIALGMAYTLVYAEPTWPGVRLAIIHAEFYQGLVVLVGDWVLNYSHGEKISKDEVHMNIIDTFIFDGSRFVKEKR